MGRALETDSITQTRRIFHEDSDGFGIETVQDVTGIVDEAKTLYNSHSHKATSKFRGDGFHHIASVPMTVMADYKKRTGIDLLRADEKEWKRFLNDRDNLFLRTKPGVI